MRRLTSLIILVLVGFGLSAGPHPCHAMRAPQAKAMPSCHVHPTHPATSSTARRVLSPATHDCCRDGQSRLCESTCQMAAALDTRIALSAVRSVAPAVPPVFDRSLPLFANTIDHIPLA
jgi:hypothetical protein